MAFFEQMNSYFKSVKPSNPPDAQIVADLADAFADIIDNFKRLKAEEIKKKPEMLNTFKILEDLTGNLSVMIQEKAHLNPKLGFTGTVRDVKDKIATLSETLRRMLTLSSVIILTQSDLIMEELKKI